VNIWYIPIGLVLVGVSVLHARQMWAFLNLYRSYRSFAPNIQPRQSFLEFLEFARAYYDYAPSLEERIKGFQDPFLREAVGAFLHGGLVGHDLLRTLRQKADQRFELDMALMHDLNLTIRGLPVVGWALAICAAIWMFSGGAEAITFQRAGTAFSVCLGGILYGVVLTYFMVMPIMEKMWRAARENRAKNCALIEGLGHLMRKQNAFELFETVQVLLPDNVKPQWGEVFADKMKLTG
jgi:flagellar motor component MotA